MSSCHLVEMDDSNQSTQAMAVVSRPFINSSLQKAEVLYLKQRLRVSSIIGIYVAVTVVTPV